MYVIDGDILDLRERLIKAILDTLKECRSLSVRDLSYWTGFSYSKVRRTVKKLARMGIVELQRIGKAEVVVLQKDLNSKST